MPRWKESPGEVYTGPETRAYREAPAPGGNTHHLAQNETISEVAQRLLPEGHTHAQWMDMIGLIAGMSGIGNPNMVKAGQKLTLPGQAPPPMGPQQPPLPSAWPGGSPVVGPLEQPPPPPLFGAEPWAHRRRWAHRRQHRYRRRRCHPQHRCRCPRPRPALTAGGSRPPRLRVRGCLSRPRGKGTRSIPPHGPPWASRRTARADGFRLKQWSRISLHGLSTRPRRPQGCPRSPAPGTMSRA